MCSGVVFLIEPSKVPSMTLPFARRALVRGRPRAVARVRLVARAAAAVPETLSTAVAVVGSGWAATSSSTA